MQIGAVIGIWRLCVLIVHVLDLPLPAGVLGMLLVLVLLLSGLLDSKWLNRGMNCLLDHMVLFFVPAMMGVLNHRELFSATGLKIFAVIVINVLVVMTATFAVVEFLFFWRNRNER
jgi:holin-like protein